MCEKWKCDLSLFSIVIFKYDNSYIIYGLYSRYKGKTCRILKNKEYCLQREKKLPQVQVDASTRLPNGYVS